MMINLISSFGFGVIVSGVFLIFAGIFAPRWRPGDYARLVDIGFEACIAGAIIVIAGYAILGV